ncbi:class I SAM-dependent methyltransferase [Agromyces aerolatus]|uniref:class I SAM-dependent methyltransferase n=1 Tax=Agromyces sp. LY-1074 TaxID=3074080 RepID=UPI0028585EAD|nr:MULTISPECIES: class I SAM-dependent methyltransferase [unclassified Agromyces]MDR5698238.1 class I SAM-dependent methyltransferase [Agromyces sp. LY-1074]MDR5704532.1 class I SAM-dependent methyltransferase [Agromyces sp. LY-1358]
MPVGSLTRGTTNTNRLRRVDRWIAAHPVLRRADDPLVVDLGYGASGVTAFELASRLGRTRPEVEVLGLEIDPGRVRTAREQLAAVRAGTTPFARDLKVSFGVGGFEVPVAAGRRPAMIRAFNVLRQYDEASVTEAWSRLRDRLAPGGLVVEGTCDELGRISSWVGLEASGPVTFSISLRLRDLDAPSIVAERLPKALIHRNVPGERVHTFLTELDRAWRVHAPLSVYGPGQRFIRVAETLKADGWPVQGGVRRWRLGELTLDWSAVAPRPSVE